MPTAANGMPAFGHYNYDPVKGNYTPWALLVLEPTSDGIGCMTFSLEPEALFPRFGLPLSLSNRTPL